jgi:hypothetical protein
MYSASVVPYAGDQSIEVPAASSQGLSQPTQAPAPLAPEDGQALPKNYAYHPKDGYKGLLLHDLVSPRVAEFVYPIIASRWGEAVTIVIMFTSLTLTSTPVLIDHSLSRSVTKYSWFLYVPALQRVALLDVRVLRLLARQFETW